MMSKKPAPQPMMIRRRRAADFASYASAVNGGGSGAEATMGSKKEGRGESGETEGLGNETAAGDCSRTTGGGIG